MDAQAVVEVFLLAENRLLREALIRILAKKSDIRIVGAAPYSPDSQDQIISARPSIVVLDSTGPIFGTKLLANLRAAVPGARIVLVDMELDERTFLKAVGQGVVGYVLKDASASEVSATIRAVFAGEAVCPPALSMTLFNVVQRCQLPAVSSRVLSRREEELVVLLRKRLTNKEIASRLNLSEQTVKNHVHRILRKVGASDRLAVVDRYEWEAIGGGSAEQLSG